jgi:hypothetical protein
MQQDADFLSFTEPNEARKGGVDFDSRYVLLAGGLVPSQSIPSHDRRKATLALHACPSNEHRLLGGGIPRVRGAWWGRLAVREFDDDILRDLWGVSSASRRIAPSKHLQHSHSPAPTPEWRED